MFNPRWPHTFTAFREKLDANGDPVVDKDGNPTLERITFDKVIYDPQWNPTHRPDGSFATEKVTKMPWGYRTSTGGIKDSGAVFKTDFKISCPMFLNSLEEGIVLTLKDYQRTFNAVVKKCTTYNWGTNIWFDDPGNDGEPSAK